MLPKSAVYDLRDGLLVDFGGESRAYWVGYGLGVTAVALVVAGLAGIAAGLVNFLRLRGTS